MVIFLGRTVAKLFEHCCEIFVVSPMVAPGNTGLFQHRAAFAEIRTFSGFEFFIDSLRFADEKDDVGWVEFDCLKLLKISTLFLIFNFIVMLYKSFSYYLSLLLNRYKKEKNRYKTDPVF